MRHTVAILTFFSLTALCTQAKMIPPSDLKETILFTAKTTGKTYQLGKRCGADEKSVEKYKKRITTDVRKKQNDSYPKLVKDFQRVFQQGIKEGDTYFNSIRLTPVNRQTVCAQTITIIESRLNKK